jgi:glycogen phosphorylase
MQIATGAGRACLFPFTHVPSSHPMNQLPTIAYFSMEIGLSPDLPTYAGGLGVLAGDTVRSAADGGVPMVAVTLVHRRGYFRQRLDAECTQHEEPVEWSPADQLVEIPARATVGIEGRQVQLRAWRRDVVGLSGHVVPVYFLDSDLPQNVPDDRRLTDHLYGGDLRYRLCQELLLGIGGVRMLRALGIVNVERYHMNEGHAAPLVFELGHEHMLRAGLPAVTRGIVAEVKRCCVFTTHTPVPAGHDQFPIALVREVMTEYGEAYHQLASEFLVAGTLNMTYVALEASGYVNGVAKRHGEVSRRMFEQYEIDSITNGVHAGTWVAPPMRELFDSHIAGWREDNASLRYARGIPLEEVWSAHQIAKDALVDFVNQATGARLSSDRFTLGFARRMTAYKRPGLLFLDLERLLDMQKSAGPLQVILAGKAHPQDFGGKALIREICQTARRFRGELEIAFVEDYDMAVAARMVSGVDLWLNTPQAPLEASGTSGMKAALNGVPQLSVLDGWWVEGCIEGITGWAIGADTGAADGVDDPVRDADSMYGKLRDVIVPMFYQRRDAYVEVMRHAIALNGSFFNTERMIDEYLRKAYLR